ncbi:MAG: tRNA (adenosine(37)-N6)-dimethylallyltransferase MiaA [Tuberibacillus sp.]
MKVAVIVGPTASGKTALGVQLAKALNGEVVNGDASQVYKDMNIGTAKVTKEEAEGIPHHLIDMIPPEQSFTVADYQKEARQAIRDISARGKLPIIVGGTGLYIKAALFDYRFTPFAGDPELREELTRYAEEHGNEALHQKLVRLDPKAAEQIHPNNVKRVVRAIEKVKMADDETKSEPPPAEPLYDIAVIGLTMDREELYNRINKRVDAMIANGLVEEAKRLYDRGLSGCQSVQSIGYKELFRFFDGEITLPDAIQLIKRNTRHFAKRQFTWFRHQMDVAWFDAKDVKRNFSKIINFVAGMFDQRSK